MDRKWGESYQGFYAKYSPVVPGGTLVDVPMVNAPHEWVKHCLGCLGPEVNHLQTFGTQTYNFEVLRLTWHTSNSLGPLVQFLFVLYYSLVLKQRQLIWIGGSTKLAFGAFQNITSSCPTCCRYSLVMWFMLHRTKFQRLFKTMHAVGVSDQGGFYPTSVAA